MKKLPLLLSLSAGRTGTPVVCCSDCTCPTGSHEVRQPAETKATSVTICIAGFRKRTVKAAQ